MSKSDDNPVDIIYGQVEIREVKFLRGRYDLRLFFYPCFKPLIMGRMIKALRDQRGVIFQCCQLAKYLAFRSSFCEIENLFYVLYLYKRKSSLEQKM